MVKQKRLGRAVRVSASQTKRLVKSTRKHGRAATNRTSKRVVRHSKTVHHHIAVRPHNHLMGRWKWYSDWHGWNHHKHTHGLILGAYVFVILAVLISMYKVTFAADLSNSWDFSNASEFTYENASIETYAASARLKAQNYSDDANTSALYHLDEVGGTNVPDSSSNNNAGTVAGTPTFETGNLNNALAFDGNGEYFSVPDSPSLSITGQHSIEAWTKFNSAFDTNANQDQGVVDKGNYRLYYDRTSGRVNYEIANNNASSWTKQAGTDTNGSWDQDGKIAVRETIEKDDNIYVGLGTGTGDAEVWRWGSNTWTQIGGDGKNGGWADQQFEDVWSLETVGNTLYAGLGTNVAGDGEVWSCDLSSGCNDWDKIGGDGLGWAINTYESVTSLREVGGVLYAGLGRAQAGDAEVWRHNGGTSWTRIGGDGTGWANSAYEDVTSMTDDGTNLYAGLGVTAGDSEIYRYDGANWTKIAGDNANNSWDSGTPVIEQVLSMTYFGGSLYAGTGTTAGEGDVWRWNGSTWTQIGGDGTGWAASLYEGVYSLKNDGTNLYAGVGLSNGEGEMWRYNGSTWTQIGGDGLNGGWTTAQGDTVMSAVFADGVLYAGLHDAGGDATLWSWNGSAWTRLGGAYVNKSWGFYNLQSVESSTTYNDKLYVGTGITVAGNAMVWQFDGSSWTLVGGQGINGSWPQETYENVYTLQTYKGELYAGLGSTANDAEVWKFNGSSWTKVGGDNLNLGWNTNYEAVNVLAVHNGDLYAGLGVSADDAEVWRWNGSVWSKIAGDDLNSGWTNANNIESVLSMTVYNGQLYVGTGTTAGDADVWRWNGSNSWTKVGGDGVASSWNTDYEEVFIMRVYNGKLIAGLGNGADDAEVWSYDGSVWSKIGGDDVSGSWTSGTNERIRAMAIYNGELYAGVGDTAGDGEVWRYNGSTWDQIGGDSLNSGWTNVVEYVSTLLDYKGKLYAGTGNTGNADAALWSYGNNAFLASSQTSQNTDWHHVAATYNGTTMKIFIDGIENASANASVSMGDNSLPLLVGSTYGSGTRGESQGYINGKIDELRISSTARSAFTSKPYVSDKKAISPNEAAYKSSVESFDSFAASETGNGGSIGYRLSNDNGETWQYWDGDEWQEAQTLNDSNPQSVINDNIAEFPVTFDGIKWQAVFSGNGNQQVTLNSVTIEANSDTDAPQTNASSISAFRTNGGAGISSNGWTNGGSPYFSWDAGADEGSGILGYCVYLGQDNSADPITTKGLLGNSPVDTGDNCEFVTPSNSLDLSTAGLLGTALTTSSSSYYLSIKAIDKAGNVFGSSAQFQFRFDNTAPSNPGFVTAPSGFINTKEAVLTWPTNGGQAASDGASGVAGLQYKIGSSSWYGDSHTGTGDSSDLLANDGSYTTTETPDFNNLNEGVNTVYFRTWDHAGNVTSGYVSAALKINTNGAPSSPQNLSVNPSINTSNSFSFDWDVPATFVGSVNNLNYCYTVNTLPSASTCNYTGAGVTSLAAGPFATQPGENTLYVTAKDESNNINYASYTSINFQANTPAPGIPTNTDIVDVSIKSTGNWRLAITWDAPNYAGAGISSYKVYRSTNNSTFNFAGSSTSTTYIDAGLSQQTYYYRIVACDSTNNCSANGTTVSLTPTGKFTEPANLTNTPETSNITTKRAKISWSTDRASDSKVAIGTSSGQYSGSEIGNSDQVTAHDIKLDNLAAGTTYYYKVKWTDEDGNTGTSQEFSFTTNPAPVMKEINTAKVGLTNAVVNFTVTGANKVNLYFGESESFGGLKSINTSNAETTYSIELDGLRDGAKYFYQLSAFDAEGGEYRGNIFTFNTPPRPAISNLRFEPVKGEATSTQSVSWNTNVPATSTVTYGKVGTNGTDIQDSQLVTDHKVLIKGLEDDSQYFLLAQSRDGDGNLATSDRQIFKTDLDTRPPKVSDISIEPSIRGTGAEARGQIIVSWKTDEPSTSQVGYAEGSAATSFNNKTTEDTNLTTEHIVVVSDLPTSKVYSLQVISYDKARNAGLGVPESAIIGRGSDNALTIILDTLQRVFGL